MRILVTGGNGRIGHFVVAELSGAGHEVTNMDLVMPRDPVPGVASMLGNVTSLADVYGALAYSRAEAVVHLAAWADPGIVADARTYANNTAAMFNILDVCTTLALSRAIVASSAQVYGFAGAVPVYAPVDESHPLRPLNSYALSKVAGEQAAAYFAGKGLNVLSFRIMGARAPEGLADEIAKVKANPENDRALLWTRTDARDIAIGCRQALEKEHVESGVYNLTAARNVLGLSTQELLARYCPDTKVRTGFIDDGSALSTAKAKAAFGYAPRYG